MRWSYIHVPHLRNTKYIEARREQENDRIEKEREKQERLRKRKKLEQHWDMMASWRKEKMTGNAWMHSELQKALKRSRSPNDERKCYE